MKSSPIVKRFFTSCGVRTKTSIPNRRCGNSLETARDRAKTLCPAILFVMTSKSTSL
jgi:hypothetical protein